MGNPRLVLKTSHPKLFDMDRDHADMKRRRFIITAGGFLVSFCSHGQESLELEIKRMGGQVFIDPTTKRIVEINLNGHRQLDKTIYQRIKREVAITDLSLESTPTSDSNLKLLCSLRNLEWLNLYRTEITDRGVACLSDLPRLAHLPLGETQITDKGLKSIGKLTNLEYLGLRKTSISNEGLRHLKELKKLSGLHLGETAVTNKGLPHLASLTTLKKLWLHDTEINDQGLVALSKLNALQQLMVYNTGVTQKGYQFLHRHLPGCLIVYRIED